MVPTVSEPPISPLILVRLAIGQQVAIQPMRRAYNQIYRLQGRVGTIIAEVGQSGGTPTAVTLKLNHRVSLSVWL